MPSLPKWVKWLGLSALFLLISAYCFMANVMHFSFGVSAEHARHTRAANQWGIGALA